jgi:hypothetical protein
MGHGLMPSSTVTISVADETASKSSQTSLSYLYGIAGLLGATVQDTDYSGDTWLTAAKQFNSYVGADLALSMGKRYLQPTATTGGWPTAVPPSIAQLHGTGCRFLIDVKPGGTSAAMTTAEQDSLSAFLEMLTGAGVDFDIDLWNEANLAGSNPPFTSAAVFHEWFAYYAPTVKAAGVKVVYNPAMYAPDIATAVAFYPGDQYVDILAADVYWDDFNGGSRLDALAALADNHLPEPAPLGIAEFGVGHPATVPTQAEFEEFTSYLGEFFYARLAAGKENYSLLYYNPNLTSAQKNLVTSASDFKVAGIQSIYSTVSLQALGN